MFIKKTGNGMKEVMVKYHKAEKLSPSYYITLYNNNKLLKNKQDTDIVNNVYDFNINLGPKLASQIKKPNHKYFRNYIDKNQYISVSNCNGRK